MSTSSNNPPPPLPNTTRHTLPPESELRLEVPFGITCTVTLRSGSGSTGGGGGSGGGGGGSAELFGAELAPERPIHLTGAKVAIFTWHGCTLDVSNEDKLDILYVSEETDCNVSYVNTHAQLEAMRDEALSSLLPNPQQGGGGGMGSMLSNNSSGSNDGVVEGPRVLLVGPADCGKSSLARVLTAYAVKLGRTPLLVDLDASQNMLSLPGTLAVSPVSADCISSESYGTSSLMNGGSNGAMMPLVLWYGSMDPTAHPDLYKAQLEKLGVVIEGRLAGDVDARASGVIVNASGCIEDVGYTYLLDAIDAFRINVVVVMGHDRLYSMMGTHFKKKAQEEEAKNEASPEGESGPSQPQKISQQLTPKLIKLPRSGGVVSRDATFRRASRSQCIKRYFYGDIIPPKPTDPTANTASAAATTHYQFTPCLIEVPFADVHLHKLSNISLSASMLPVGLKQTTDPIQIADIHSSEISTKFQHAVFAVCHPSAVERFEQSGKARDLYLAGVAGFVVVEKVDVDKEMLSLLSPCAGSLPSGHLLVGDISWVE